MIVDDERHDLPKGTGQLPEFLNKRTAITAEQLDELEQRAQAVKDAEKAAAQAFSIGEIEPQLQARTTLREARAAHGPANSPDVTLRLVAIARAALAWSEADDARQELAKRARSDMSIMAEFMLMDDDESHPSDHAVHDALRTLYAATRGTP